MILCAYTKEYLAIENKYLTSSVYNTCTGVVIYLLYGIRHSVAAKSLQHVPDEQRILLPPDDDHVTQELSDDVTSASDRRLTGNSSRGAVNARTATPLRL